MPGLGGCVPGSVRSHRRGVLRGLPLSTALNRGRSRPECARNPSAAGPRPGCCASRNSGFSSSIEAPASLSGAGFRVPAVSRPRETVRGLTGRLSASRAVPVPSTALPKSTPSLPRGARARPYALPVVFGTAALGAGCAWSPAGLAPGFSTGCRRKGGRGGISSSLEIR